MVCTISDEKVCRCFELVWFHRDSPLEPPFLGPTSTGGAEAGTMKEAEIIKRHLNKKDLFPKKHLQPRFEFRNSNSLPREEHPI
jgi:hypothetical protein